jgi:hypothetical protein
VSLMMVALMALRRLADNRDVRRHDCLVTTLPSPLPIAWRTVPAGLVPTLTSF